MRTYDVVAAGAALLGSALLYLVVGGAVALSVYGMLSVVSIAGMLLAAAGMFASFDRSAKLEEALSATCFGLLAVTALIFYACVAMPSFLTMLS